MIVCGTLLVLSLILFAVSFVFLGRAEQRGKTGYWMPRRGIPDVNHLTTDGQRLLLRGQKIRRIAFAVFGLFVILALLWR
jgi:hypothetical protein